MQEFQQRREKLAQKMQPNSIALLSGAKLVSRTSSSYYPFRQDNDFYYLSGFIEADAKLAICKDDHNTIKYILFSTSNDPNLEIWDGKKIGQDDACNIYLANEAFDVAKIDEIIPKLLLDKKIIYYPIGIDEGFDSQIVDWIKLSKKLGRNAKINFASPLLEDLSTLIHELRVIKSPYEIDLMRKAAQISAAAHHKLMQNVKPKLYEYQLEAMFVGHCMDVGARSQAYNPIVASGNNACTLHYVANDQKLRDGDLVLVDAGGEYEYYASDITRTFPVNGKFNTQQKQIYSLVLAAQLQGIAQIKPGNTFDSIQQAMLEVMVAGLVELGLLKGDVKQLIADSAYTKYYMHSSGHWLGLDVHDPGLYRINSKSRILEAGMVLTVEPGIYIAKTLTGIDPKWLGIGVRIEDDILVTETGYEILSSGAPKTIEEIESATV